MIKIEGTNLIILIFLMAGFIEIILGIPLLLEKIKPNWFYGFRTPKSLSNKEIWYKANKYVATDIIIAGCITVIGSLCLLLTGDDLSIETNAYIGSFLIVTPLIIVLVRGFIYLKKL